MTESRPRIAYYVTLFPKLSESFVLNEVVELRRRGLDIRVISFDSSHRLEQKRHGISDETGEVFYTSDARPWRPVGALLWWLGRRPGAVLSLWRANKNAPVIRGDSRLGRLANVLVAAREVRRSGAVHIHSHWSYPTDAASLTQVLTSTSRSATLHAHDIFEDLDLYEKAGQPTSARIGPLIFVITCTHHNQMIVRARLSSDLHSRIHAAYHGLDPRFFAPPSRVAPSAPLRLVSVGRLVPYKGFDLIVRALGELVSRGTEARLVIAGSDGSLTPVVTALVEDLRLGDRVELRGGVTQAEVAQLLAEADLFVNHSDPVGEYGVANVIVEAMSSGLPVVVTRRPQVEEYLEDGVNGVLVEHGDLEGVVEALQRLANDPDLRARLGAAARVTATERFDISRTAEGLRRLLLEAAKQ